MRLRDADLPGRNESGGDEAGEGAAALARLLQQTQAAGIARHALLVSLTSLPQARLRPHHVRLARAALDPLRRADRARLFGLGRGPVCDLVVTWRGEAEATVQACIAALAHLLDTAPEALPPGLLRRLQLPDEAAVLLAAIDAARAPPEAVAASNGQLAALDTVALATLEAHLERADVARFARRRDICAPDARGRFALRWEKRFLSVAELSETLLPERAVQADPWLFRRLTRTLDRRLMALLAAPGELAGAGPFSLNINVGSILAPEFLRFDAALPAPLRGHVVLELAPADVLADPAAFLFARDFARVRGYRLALRGVGAELLDLMPLGLSGLDLLQLRWSPALRAVTALPAEPGAIVLARVDDREAIAWGLARGIGLFAGPLVARGGWLPAQQDEPPAALAPRSHAKERMRA